MTLPRYPKPSVSLPGPAGGNAMTRWRAAFRARTVVFTSPLPTAECSRRLQAATAHSQMGAYFGSIASSGPAPRLYGTAAPPQFRVALMRGSRRGGNWRPVFDGVIKPGPGGGTILRGTVGPPSSSRSIIMVTAAVLTVLVIAVSAGLVASIVSGSGLGPTVLLVPLTPLTVVNVSIAASLPGRIRSGTGQLLGELSEILGSTVTMES